MDRLKPVFITLYILFLLVALIYSGVAYFQSDKQLLFVSAFGTAFLPASYFAYLYLKRPFRVETVLLILTTATATLTLITVGDRFYNNAPYNDAVLIALISLIGWLLYHQWYATLKPHISVQMGDQFPECELHLSNGQTIQSLSALSGEFKLVVFHRGSWCPFCVAQSVEYDHGQAKWMEKLHIISVSPQPPVWSKRFAQRVSNQTHVVIDEDNKLAALLGIVHTGNLPLGLGLLGFKSSSPYPTSILLDSDNRIIHIHQSRDYRKRPGLEFWERFVSK